MADEEFIKKIGLRKNYKRSETVEADKSNAESTVSEENVDIKSKDINEDLSCKVTAAAPVEAPEEAPVEAAAAAAEEEAPVEAPEEETVADKSKENSEISEVNEETNAEEINTEGTNTEEEFPTSIQFEDELIRVKYKLRYRKLLKNTLYSLLIVAAVSVLIATLFLPVLEIYGSSMNPTLENGDIVVCVKTTNLKRGDICGMYYNNHLLVKRVVGLPGDSIEMDEAGNLFVNGEYVDEPYVSEKILGECDLDFPYIVPEQTVFILGDNRPVAVDSRNEQFGCISYEEIQGKIIFRVWPFKSFGIIG
ncbi:MAG: signal peptidase I [Ruminococcaceae bacterium]|nr:signal peptidase I [Oscillospiraceae bacterium]